MQIFVPPNEQVMCVDLVKNWAYLENPRKTLYIYLFSIIFSLGLGKEANKLTLLPQGLMPMIDNFAHVGGFIMGILAALVFAPSGEEKTYTLLPNKAALSTV
jgi:membrane associated rhomboid family serine protease